MRPVASHNESSVSGDTHAPGIVSRLGFLFSGNTGQKGLHMSPKPLDGQMVALALSLMSPSATVAAPGQHIENPPHEIQQVYGSQFMSPQERREYSVKMSSLKTPQEQEAFRLQHQQQMQLRATAKGVTLPAATPRTESPSGQSRHVP